MILNAVRRLPHTVRCVAILVGSQVAIWGTLWALHLLDFTPPHHH